MNAEDRNFLLTAADAEQFRNDAVGCYYTEQLAIRQAKETIISILNHCKDKRLAFSDDGNGNDLTATIYEIGHEPETRLVDEVKMRDDAIVVVDETRKEWYPWEVDIGLIELLMAMGDELQREFNL